MNITCLKDNLAKGLSIVSKAIPLKHSMPVLSNVLLSADGGRLKLTGTNMETYISTYVGASVNADGDITIPAKTLAEYVSHLSHDTVSLTLEDDTLHVLAGKAKSKFNGVSAKDFPNLPDVKIDIPHIEIDTKTFCKAINQVGFAVAHDETRPVFSGILLHIKDNTLYLVASDGFRLNEKTLSVDTDLENVSVVLPAKTLLEISRIFSSLEDVLKIYFDDEDNRVIFEGGDTVVTTGTIYGNYPDYKRIIPTESTLTATFQAASLLEAVRLANVFASSDDSAIKITFDPKGSILVQSVSQETGSNNSELDATVEGDSLELSFNSKYLLEILSNLKDETLSLSTKGVNAACVIKPSNANDFLHVIMPLVQNN